MQYRIIHKPEFWIIGFIKRITLQFEGENHQFDELWEKLTDETRRELLALNGDKTI